MYSIRKTSLGRKCFNHSFASRRGCIPTGCLVKNNIFLPSDTSLTGWCTLLVVASFATTLISWNKFRMTSLLTCNDANIFLYWLFDGRDAVATILFVSHCLNPQSKPEACFQHRHSDDAIPNKWLLINSVNDKYSRHCEPSKQSGI